jgi:hypothetical protein
MKIIRNDLTFNSKTDGLDTILGTIYFVLSMLIPITLLVVLTFCRPLKEQKCECGRADVEKCIKDAIDQKSSLPFVLYSELDFGS